MFNDADEAQIVGKDLTIELDDDVYNCVRLKSLRERITENCSEEKRRQTLRSPLVMDKVGRPQMNSHRLAGVRKTH